MIASVSALSSGVSAAPASSTICRLRVERQRRPQQVRHALLPGDPADERDVRAARVDAELVEHVGVGVGPVEVGVDAVVDDVHRGPRTIAGYDVEDVARHARG